MFTRINALFLTSVFVTNVSFGATYWVSESGSDSNGCTSQSDSCLTIQKGISVLNPGDTLYISAGTYIEDSSKNPATKKCGWFDPLVASLCINKSGTKESPITISAAPDDEGKVIVDSEGVRAGVQLNSNDYITFKGMVFKNHFSVGIANWGQVENEVANLSPLAEGIVIDGNIFLNTYGSAGDNVSSVAMWGSKDWIVRNNLIDGVTAGGSTVAAGIQSYGVINALIENNTIRNVGYGIFWKDHYVKNATTRELWQESEIRFNRITASSEGIRISIRGSRTVEAGHSYIHHNIIDGLKSGGIGIHSAMAGAFGPSGDLVINNNLVDGGGNSATVGISVDAHRTLSLKANILTRVNLGVELIKYSDVNLVKLISSNYNIFDPSFQNIVDRYSNTSKSFSSLNSWKTVTAGSSQTLSVNSPDVNSITASFSNLFANNTKYDYATSSPARNLVSTGINAGPYETGQEVIGLSAGNPPAPPPRAQLISQ